MSLGDAVSIMRGAIFEMLLVAGPILLVGMVVGLVVSIFQATTSIQEQTLTFVPKIIAILLVLAFFGGWMFDSLKNYTINLFHLIPRMRG